MRAITNDGQLQNNCPLFVWPNQGNFMQSVIKSVQCLLWRAILPDFFLNSIFYKTDDPQKLYSSNGLSRSPIH